MKLRPLHFVLPLGLGVIGAQGMDLNTLVERSPFAPPGVKTSEQVNEAPTQLEFRGIATDESGTMFSVYDMTANRGYWVREGEAGAVSVKSFDPAESQILVEQGGRTVPLKLKRATIQAGAAVAPAAGGAPNFPSPNANAANRAAVNPAADAKRLEAVAAEVRRRRALRNAAQAGAPAPAATPAPAAP